MTTPLLRSRKFSVTTPDLILEIPDVFTYLISVPAVTSADVQICMENKIIARPSDMGTLTFVVTANTLTRSKGSFLDDNFAAGMTLSIAGTASNNGTAYVIGTVTATTLTLSSGAFANETITHATDMVTAIYDAAAVWFTWASVAASNYKYETFEFGPKGIRFKRTSGASALTVWTKS